MAMKEPFPFFPHFGSKFLTVHRSPMAILPKPNLTRLNTYLGMMYSTSLFQQVRLSVHARVSVRHKIFFSLKSPWNHPLTPGVNPRG